MATDEVPKAPEIPEIYTDGVQIGVGPFGIVLSFALSAPAPAGAAPPKVVCNVRMSLEHAKILSILLKKNLKNFEDQIRQPIPIPNVVADGLGLSLKEDW